MSGVSVNTGPPSWRYLYYNKDYHILGSALGSPCVWEPAVRLGRKDPQFLRILQSEVTVISKATRYLPSLYPRDADNTTKASLSKVHQGNDHPILFMKQHEGVHKQEALI